MEPHRIKRGMLSGLYNQEVQMLSLQQQSTDVSNVVIQGLPWEKLHPGIFLQKKNQPQQKQKQPRAQPWQKKTWKKKDEEDR